MEKKQELNFFNIRGSILYMFPDIIFPSHIAVKQPYDLFIQKPL